MAMRTPSVMPWRTALTRCSPSRLISGRFVMRLTRGSSGPLKQHQSAPMSASGPQRTSLVDAEVVHLSSDGAADFDALHSRTADENAVALAFDLLLAGDDI